MDREEMPEEPFRSSMDIIAMIFTLPWLITVFVVLVLVCTT